MKNTNTFFKGAKSWFDCAARFDYEDCEGDLGLNWKDKGYIIFLDVLTKKYPDESQRLGVYEKAILNKKVSQIK